MMKQFGTSWWLSLMALMTLPIAAAEPFTVLDLWHPAPPGPARELGPEKDFTKPSDRLIAGRRIIKLGNVTTPQAHVFLPPREKANGAGVVVCPGGGFSILAWDLEGTEVAQWLNGIGVAAIVLKYRVPTRDQDPRWLAPVQDAQRTLSLARHHAASWNIDPKRIGILGFSAGGETAGQTSIQTNRLYEVRDKADSQSCIPDFSALIYTAGFADRDTKVFKKEIVIPETAPPTFLAHAADDRVPVENSVLLFLALKEKGIPADLHVYAAGGHGYGLRETSMPVTTWHHRCADWMEQQGFLKPKP